MDEIVADILQDQVSTEGCMDTWTTETLALAIQSDRSTTLWSGLKISGENLKNRKAHAVIYLWFCLKSRESKEVSSNMLEVNVFKG